MKLPFDVDQAMPTRRWGKMRLRTLLTGSTVYGDDPNDRDFLVIGSSRDLAEFLADGWDYGGSFDDALDSGFDPNPDQLASAWLSIKKGNDNIVLTCWLEFIVAWLRAHDECVKNAPVTKEESRAVFKRHREAMGVMS